MTAKDNKSEHIKTTKQTTKIISLRVPQVEDTIPWLCTYYDNLYNI